MTTAAVEAHRPYGNTYQNHDWIGMRHIAAALIVTSGCVSAGDFDHFHVVDGAVPPDLVPPPKIPPPGGLAGYWSLDDSVMGTAQDMSGNNNNGMIRGATAVMGKVGPAYRFDGMSSITVPQSPSLDMAGSTSMTVMAWVFADPCTTGDAAVASKTGEYALFVHCGSEIFEEETSTTGNGWVPNGTHAISVGSWHHLAATWDGTTVRQYVDGLVTDQSHALGGSLSASGVLGSAYGFGIGCGNVPPSGMGTVAYNFTGTIDEVVVYNRTLSPTELLNYFNATN